MLHVSNLVGRKTITLTWVAIMILALIAPAFFSCTTEETELVHLKVVDLPYQSATTFHIAQEEGFFAEQGLEVEFVKFTSVSQAVPLLVTGDLDVGYGSINAGLINAIAQNLDLKIVAGADYTFPERESQCLVVRKGLYDSGELDSIVEVKGRKVALFCTACAEEFALSKTLELANLTLSDITIVKMSPQDVVAAFETGALDAAIMSTPRTETLKSLGLGVILQNFGALMPGFHYGFLMFGPSLLKDNPEAGKKFMTAYLKGVQIYLEGPTENNLEIAGRCTGTDRQTLLECPWPQVDPHGEIHVEDILTFQEWAYDNGFVDEKLSGEQLIDTTFIDYANEAM